MSGWNRFWYGDPHPLPAKKAAAAVIGTLVVACWFGLRLEFMVSEQWLPWGTSIALTVSLLITPWFSRLCADMTGADLTERAVRIPFHLSAFAAASFVSCTLIVFAFPGMSTKWTGTKVYAHAQLRKERHFGRRECDFQIRGEYIKRQPAGYICISGAEFEALPEHGVMRVREKRSIFGVYVEGVMPESANKRVRSPREMRAPDA